MDSMDAGPNLSEYYYREYGTGERELPFAVLQLDPPDRAVLKIAGNVKWFAMYLFTSVQWRLILSGRYMIGLCVVKYHISSTIPLLLNITL